MYCTTCGKEIGNSSKHCKYCGAIQPSPHPADPGSSTPLDSADMPPAGFWIRTGAFLLDYIFLIIGAIIVGLLIGGFGEISDAAAIVAFVAYHTLFLAWLSSTPGKLLYGLRVVDKSGDRVGFWRGLSRSVSYIISSFLLGAGFWTIAFNKPNKDGWHDQIAGTHVVRYRQRSIALATTALVLLAAGIIALNIYGSSFSSEVPFVPEQLYDTGRVIENPNLDPGQTAGDRAVGAISNQQLAVSVQVQCPQDASGDLWSYGSGTIATGDGLVLTNYHVVEGTPENLYCVIAVTDNITQPPKDVYAAEVYETVNDQGGTVIYSNPDLDVALLNIVKRLDGAALPSSFPEADFGSSDALNFGDSVTFIGYPGFGGGTITVTSGIVSGRVGSDYIKTTAKIDKGNSGGGAFDSAGKLVGIPTLGHYGEFEGLSYIIGLDSIRYWVQQLDAE